MMQMNAIIRPVIMFHGYYNDYITLIKIVKSELIFSEELCFLLCIKSKIALLMLFQ